MASPTLTLIKIASLLVKVGALIALALGTILFIGGLILLASGEAAASLFVIGGVVVEALGFALAKTRVPEPPEKWSVIRAALIVIVLTLMLGLNIVFLLLAFSIASLVLIYIHKNLHPEAYWIEPPN